MASEIFFASQSGVLSAGDRQIILTDQGRRCLTYFCLNAGQIVSREAFTRDCWGSRGLVVSDATVRQTVFRLRRSFIELGLGDDILQTRGKAGYLLAPDVITVTDLAQAEGENEEESANEGENANEAESVNEEAPAGPTLSGSAITDATPLPAPPAPARPRARPFSRRAGLTLLLMLLCAGAGYLYRLQEMITTVSYAFSHAEGGRSYFVSPLAGAGQAKEAMARAARWLTKENVPAADSRYVYVNGVLGDYVFIMACTAPIDEKDAGCSTLTILGRYHP